MSSAFESEILLRAGYFHWKRCRRRLDPAQNFAGPQLFGKQCKKPVLKIANRAVQIISKCTVVRVHAMFGEFAFDGRIA